MINEPLNERIAKVYKRLGVLAHNKGPGQVEVDDKTFYEVRELLVEANAKLGELKARIDVLTDVKDGFKRQASALKGQLTRAKNKIRDLST